MKNQGYTIVLDSVMALILIVLVASAVMTLQFSKVSESGGIEFTRVHYVSEDSIEALNKKGVLDEIATLWATNSTPGSPEMQNASDIAESYLEDLLPRHFGYTLTLDGDVIADSSGNPDRLIETNKSTKTHATRLLVGYAPGMPTQGLVSRATLFNIQSKTSSSFLYFGGFVGQGNISQVMYLPSNITFQEAYMELNAGDDFRLYINGNPCNGIYSPGAGAMAANIKEDISACMASLAPDAYNLFSLNFTGDNISRQYVGGGYVEVRYNTSEMDTSPETGTMRFYFPRIDGFINYYSSFYVPGWVNTMTLNVSFVNNHSTFMYIGDELIFNVSGGGGKQTITNDSAQLIGLLGASAVSETTVPIRIGTEGDFNISQIPGNADVILITDLSGSMRWRIGYNDSTVGVQRNCSDAQLFDNDTRRISLAKCLDKEFAESILNVSGNKVGLVGFTTDANTFQALTDDNTTLIDHIDAYSDAPSGGTCICCAINRAISLLSNSSDRKNYIIVMTDGVTGYHCGGCAYASPCDCAGSCNATTGIYDCDGNPSDCNGTQCDTAIGDAICGAERAHSALNATVYSIGFGPVATDCPNANRTLNSIASCGGGEYFGSQNASELEGIYAKIAEEIANASFTSQKVLLSGAEASSANATLYGYSGSYLEFTYDPLNLTGYGEISLTQKSDPFNDPVGCVGHLDAPDNVTFSELKVTSYSGEYWTDYLKIGSFEPYVLWSQYAGTPYVYLGDPFIVNVPDPESVVAAGEINDITIQTGKNQMERTNCSADDRAIYTLRVKTLVGYGNVFQESEGCVWDIQFEDGSFILGEPIPPTYPGAAVCSYTTAGISGYENDSVGDAVYRLLSGIDVDGNGRVDILFDADDIDFQTTNTGGVRSLWGPVEMKLIVWV